MKRWIAIAGALLLLFCAALAEETGTEPLQYGDKGDAVLQLQTRLKELLYYNGPLSGQFAEMTRSAVQKVQGAYDLEQNGIADAETQAIIYGDCYRELSYNMTGKDVQRLQEALTAYGYYSDRVSGSYLKNTRSGVAAFQAANGMEATGVADVKTQALLYSGTVPLPTPTPSPTAVPDLSYQGTLRNGSTGPRVRLLQERLAELGFYEGQITTGYYARTTAAVKAFQTHNALKVDGVCGEDTWNAVFSERAVPASATPVPPTPVPYFLEVDVANQVVKVYTRDEADEFTVLHKVFICSSGTVGFPSDVGTWTLSGRHALWAQFPKWGGGTAQYWTQITESIAFHSVMYEDYDATKLKVGSYNKLGTRASHGCIRLTVPDAKWIYNNCGAGVQVWIHEDAEKDPELTASVKPGSINPNTHMNYVTPTPTVSPAYDSQHPPETLRKLTEGSKGEDVYWLQMRLKELGFYNGTVTGAYHGGTKNAVKAYQKSVGLSADGVAGTNTLRRLYADAMATPAPTETPAPTPEPVPEFTIPADEVDFETDDTLPPIEYNDGTNG